jgi:hypothetical protein
VFVTGFVIFLSTILVLVKLPRRLMLRALHYDIAIDVAVSVVVLVLHFGTFSGLVAATFAGLLTSVATSTAKRAFGHIHRGRYYPGWINLRIGERS